MRHLGKTRHIHFVGIGGIGMSGIAELLVNAGYLVSGSDLRRSSVTRRLSAFGCRIVTGHARGNVQQADVVVFSSAVPPDNPEIQEARERGIPVIPRAEMLAELMRLKFGIAIAGAHGKTTTTSMLASILMAGGMDPTVVIGGRLDIWGGSNAKLGQGDILVAEADESDGSFLALSPTIAVVTNIDQEHLDHYRDMETLRDTFVDFINKVPFYGTAILCLDNEELQGILPRLKKKVITYGLSAQADLRAREIVKERFGVSFDVIAKGHSRGRVTVGMPGDHNVLNALAATAVGLELDLEMEVVRKGLKNLGGLARRFHLKGEAAEVLIMDDYGHHPAEIMATLRTAKESFPERRLLVLFQPHRYSRTQGLFDRFSRAFNDAEVLMLLPIYPAGERPLEGVSAERLVTAIREHGHRDVRLCKDEEHALKEILSCIRAQDLVLTLGAGDVYRVGERVLAELSKGVGTSP